MSASGKSVIKFRNILELSNLFYNLHVPYDTYFIRLSLFPCFKNYSQKFLKPYFLALTISCINFGLGFKKSSKRCQGASLPDLISILPLWNLWKGGSAPIFIFLKKDFDSKWFKGAHQLCSFLPQPPLISSFLNIHL